MYMLSETGFPQLPVALLTVMPAPEPLDVDHNRLVRAQLLVQMFHTSLVVSPATAKPTLLVPRGPKTKFMTGWLTMV